MEPPKIVDPKDKRSEKEKMIQGSWYLARDAQLDKDRFRARRLFEKYNKTSISETDERKQILSSLFHKLGKNVYIEPDFKCDYGYNITLHDNVYMNFGCTILDCGPVELGEGTLLAVGVHISSVGHSVDPDHRKSGLEFTRPVRIGKNCWLGSNVTILPGVTIGDNAVVGAGAVVTRSLPANSVSVGVPAKVIRYVDGRKIPSVDCEPSGQYRVMFFATLALLASVVCIWVERIFV